MTTQWLNNVMEQQGTTCEVIEGEPAIFEGILGDTEFKVVADNDGEQEINLSFSGSAVGEVIQEWNSAHPDNTISLVFGDLDYILLDDDEFILTGGKDGEKVCKTDSFNSKEDAEVLKGLFIGRYAYEQFHDTHIVKKTKMYDLI